jgi:DNA invertase Pin-like site-specific DNA recombinase
LAIYRHFGRTWQGRHPASIDIAKVRELKGGGLGATEIAKALGIGRASVYRVLEGGPASRLSRC